MRPFITRQLQFARRSIPLTLALAIAFAMTVTACDIPGFTDDDKAESETTPVVTDPDSPAQQPDEADDDDAGTGEEPQHLLPDEAFQIDSGDPDSPLADPVRIVEGGLQEPRTINPVLVDDPLSDELSRLVFSGLTRLNPETGDPEPDLATGWDVSEDGMTYTFQLREGVTWHDGQSFTAQDVEFTFDLMMDNRTRSPRFSRIVERVAAVEALDERTVEFRLINPYSPLAATIATFGIVPQHILGNVLPDELVAEPFGISTATGTGPFSLLHWDRAERIVFDANRQHHLSPPKFDQYEYRIAPDAEALLSSLEREDIDWARINARLASDVEALAEVELITIPSFEMVSVVLQLDSGITTTFENNDVRRALLHALDRQELVDLIWDGHANVAHSIIPSLSWAASEPETRYEFNPGLAGELLDAAGWTPGGDGIRQRDGAPLQFTLIANGDNPIRRNLAEWLVAQWREIGIDAQVMFDTWSNVRDQITTSRNFESLVLGYRWDVDPDQHAMWSSDSISDAFNLGGYMNRDVDRLLNEALTTNDEATRAQHYAEMQELVLNDLPVLPLAFPDQVLAIGPRLHGEEQTAILLRNRANVAGWVPVDAGLGDDTDDG